MGALNDTMKSMDAVLDAIQIPRAEIAMGRKGFVDSLLVRALSRAERSHLCPVSRRSRGYAEIPEPGSHIQAMSKPACREVRIHLVAMPYFQAIVYGAVHLDRRTF